MSVEFTNLTAEVIADLGDKCEQFLTEAGFEIESEAKRTTPSERKQLKPSWKSVVDTGKKRVTIGSSLEESFWNEFGTGSYAIHGDGRKGWWVYVEGQTVSSKVSQTYETKKDADKAVAYLRGKGLEAHSSNGQPANRTLENAFASKKNAIIARAEAIMKSLGVKK